MKKVLLLAFVIVLLAGNTFGQAGSISLSSVPTGWDCRIPDVAPGLLSAYVVHLATAGAIASQFAAPLPACAIAAVWLSDTAVYPVTIGNSQTGVAIGYGVCIGAPNHILTINLFGQGLSSTCCSWNVVPDPNVESGHIEVVDCGNNLVFGSGLSGVINGNDVDCPCVVATEENTWGQIKSIYSSE